MQTSSDLASTKLRVVDLFCGTGGFSRGAHDAGFEVAHAFDLDPVLTSSFRRNFPTTKLTLADVGQLSGASIFASTIGQVDGIVGGPPCQGFSVMGHRDGSDPRRLLVEHFFRLVAEMKPSFFVMENVVGLMQGDSRAVLDRAMSRIPKDYVVVGPTVLDASKFGLPTNRRRLFVVGVLKDRADKPDLDDFEAVSAVTVRDAIADLKNSTSVDIDSDGFDIHRLADEAGLSTYAAALRSSDRIFTGNQRTVHKPEVVERFRQVLPGATDRVGRHQRLSWTGLCPTLRAGTGSDRGSYQSVRPLHPDEPRVITVREAARLQGFPDNHRFHQTIWHSFRMIGNSVPPALGAAVLTRVKDAFGRIEQLSPRVAAE